MPTDTQLSNLKINKLTHAQYQSATKGDEFYVKQDRDGIFFNGKGVELPPGLVAPFAGSVAPAGWLICDGSAISRTTYKALFDVIGTTYGAGDGSSTFNIPNFLYKQIGSDLQVKGNNISIGLYDGSVSYVMGRLAGSSNLGFTKIELGTPVGTSWSSGTSGAKTIGLTTDGSKSGMVADTSNLSSCNMCIKY